MLLLLCGPNAQEGADANRSRDQDRDFTQRVQRPEIDQHHIDDVLAEADVVNLLRIQHERQRKEYFPSLGEYTSLFGLTKNRAAKLKPDCLIMHPGPINRGVEIDSDVADSAASVILEQVTNGLAVRMAVLYLCAGAAAGEKRPY